MLLGSIWEPATSLVWIVAPVFLIFDQIILRLINRDNSCNKVTMFSPKQSRAYSQLLSGSSRRKRKCGLFLIITFLQSFTEVLTRSCLTKCNLKIFVKQEIYLASHKNLAGPSKVLFLL